MPLKFRTEAIDDPGDLIARLPLSRSCAWVREAEGVVGWGEAARFEPGAGEDRFERAGEWLAELFGAAEVDDPLGAPGSGPVAFAAFSFDPTSAATVVVVPQVTVWRRGDRAWTTYCGDEFASERLRVTPTGKIRYAGSTIDEVAWLEAVDTAVSEIDAGRVDKIVLARDLLVWSKAPLDERALLARLVERYPECYTFAVDGFLGATPELLLEKNGRDIGSLTLAGSAARSADAAEDRRLGEDMATSNKDAVEHKLALDSVRAVLEPLCDTLDIDRAPWLLQLANVQHLASSTRGHLSTDLGLIQLVDRLHPTAAVGGTPTSDAVELIRKLEGMDRGRYAGPVGWIDSRGDGEFGIALRCAEVSGSRARLFAGAGIVAGSIPEAELEETRIKLRAMRTALGDDT